MIKPKKINFQSFLDVTISDDITLEEAIKAVDKFEEIPKRYRKSLEFMIAAVKYNGKLLDYADVEIKNNDKLIQSALLHNPIMVSDYTQYFLEHYDFLKEFVDSWAMGVYEYNHIWTNKSLKFPQKLMVNKEILKTLIENNITSDLIPKNYLDQRWVFTLIAKCCAVDFHEFRDNFIFMDPNLINDEMFMCHIVNIYPEAILSINCNNPKVILEAINKDQDIWDVLDKDRSEIYEVFEYVANKDPRIIRVTSYFRETEWFLKWYHSCGKYTVTPVGGNEITLGDAISYVSKCHRIYKILGPVFRYNKLVMSAAPEMAANDKHITYHLSREHMDDYNFLKMLVFFNSNLINKIPEKYQSDYYMVFTALYNNYPDVLPACFDKLYTKYFPNVKGRKLDAEKAAKLKKWFNNHLVLKRVAYMPVSSMDCDINISYKY